jgi:2-polyprenyl-3-methyl-5-hydroxy-6-metoxy-1,4-benzoquinol methylase
MNTNCICPLCHCGALETLKIIRAVDLIRLYKRRLAKCVAKEFEGYQKMTYFFCKSCDLRFFCPPVTGSAEYYAQLFSESTQYYLENKSEYDFARKFISQDDKVLDVGSGKGVFATRISTKKYTGLEHSPKAAELASQDGIKVINESLGEHCLANKENYDIVCAFQVLEHVSDIRKFIDESVQCLKPGGLLIYSVPSADSFVSLIPNPTLNLPPHHVSHWPDSTLRNITNLFPLELVEMEHETLAGVNKPSYAATISVQAINNLIGRKYKPLDFSFIGRAIRKIAHVAGKFYARGLQDPLLLPRGHSVTVVYRKIR